MGVKARVVVTHYDSPDEPVEPVVLDGTKAANLGFGELTPEHARRERRRQRETRRSRSSHTVLGRIW